MPEVGAALCPLEDLLVIEDSAPYIEVSHGSMTRSWALNLRVICLKTSKCACAGLKNLNLRMRMLKCDNSECVSECLSDKPPEMLELLFATKNEEKTVLHSISTCCLTKF